MKRFRIANRLGLALALLLVAASVPLLVDPGLAPVFRPSGTLHGPVLFDNASPVAVRIHAVALLLLGLGIGASLRKPRD